MTPTSTTSTPTSAPASSPTTLPPATSTASAYLRPQSGEAAPYYDRYISLVPGADVLAALDDQRRQTLLFLSGRTEADGDLRYAPDKWTLKEVVGHLNDTERIMAYRALRIARGDQTPIEGYEQDDYVRNSPFARRAASRLDRRLHSCQARHHFVVPQPGRARLDSPRRCQQKRSNGASPSLHNRRPRTASSQDFRREIPTLKARENSFPGYLLERKAEEPAPEG